jgi:hypothetical protein
MTLYLGKKAVCPTKIVKKEVAKVKYGMSIDDLLGDVDANGNYVLLTACATLDLSGIKTVGDYAFQFFAAGKSAITELLANDLVKAGNLSFASFADSNTNFKRVVADALEEVTTGSFQNSFDDATLESASFRSLKRITGNSAFNGAFSKSNLDLDEVFPNLEYISGNSAVGNIVKSSTSARATIRLSKVQTIIGATSYTNATFGTAYADIYLPSCAHVEKYICYTNRNNTLHFAAANQADIEACDGYSYKFGAKEIYFDL